MQTTPPAPISGSRESAPPTASTPSRPIVDNSPANILRLVNVFGDTTNTDFITRSQARNDAITALHAIPADQRANYTGIYEAARDIFVKVHDADTSSEGPVLERDLLVETALSLGNPENIQNTISTLRRELVIETSTRHMFHNHPQCVDQLIEIYRRTDISEVRAGAMNALVDYINRDYKSTYPAHQDDAAYEITQLALREKNAVLGRRILTTLVDRATNLGVNWTGHQIHYESVDRSLNRIKELGIGIPELRRESAQALISFVRLKEQHDRMFDSDINLALDNAVDVICQIDNPTDKVQMASRIGTDIMRNIWKYNRDLASTAAWGLLKIAGSEKGRANPDVYLLDRIHWYLHLNQLPFDEKTFGHKEPLWYSSRKRAREDRLEDFRKDFPDRTDPLAGRPPAD